MLGRSRNVLVSLLRTRALRDGRGAAAWSRLGSPSLEDWAEYLRRHGGFKRFGRDCAVSVSTRFADPYLTAIGSNVRIADAFLTGHDGSVNMLNRAFGLALDSVGPITIEDDVFVGYGSVILPGVTIGTGSIVGAGSVVSRSVPAGSVVAGSPARVIRSMEEHVELMRERNRDMPWAPLIEGRQGGFDAGLEPQLQRMRTAHFFPKAA